MVGPIEVHRSHRSLRICVHRDEEVGMKINFKKIISLVLSSAIFYCCLSWLTKDNEISIMVKLGLVGAFILFALLIWFDELRTGRGYEKKSANKANFDWGMHYFRAFAIITIMATHYAFIFGYDRFNDVFLSSSTIYFLFISGYLCQYIDQHRRDTPLAYYRKKLLNVICPFVLFSVVFLYSRGVLSFDMDSVKAILLGRAQVPFWYIPFVSLLFAISPILCRMRNVRLIVACGVFVLFFVLFPFRPGISFKISWPYTFYLYSYFSVFYVVGFVYCRFRGVLDRLIKPNWYLFLLGAVLTSILLWNPNVIGVECFARDFVRGVQRSCVLVCFLILLGFLRARRIWVLDQLAKYSFTLYFIHFGLFSQTRRLHDILISHIPLPAIMSDCIVFCIYIGLMLFAAMLVKEVLGRRSRIFLGS